MYVVQGLLLTLSHIYV